MTHFPLVVKMESYKFVSKVLMIRSILIDDEKHCLRTLELSLDKYCPEVEIIASCDSPNKALEFMKTSNPDLLFLDIEMPKMNGFELLEKLENFHFDIIFTTAFDEYALNAFKVNAVDYLLKPIDEKELIQAVNKVRIRKDISQKQVDNILSKVNKNLQTNINKIPISTSKGIDFVSVSDILYCRAESNYTFICFADNSKKLISKTLKAFEETLPKACFFRSHQSYVVNLQHVDTYIRSDGGYLVMSNGHKVAISRAKRESFLKTFTQ